MQFLSDAVGSVPAIEKFISNLNGNGQSSVLLHGLPDIGRAVFSTYLAEKTEKKLFVVTETEAVASRLAEDIKALGKKTVIFPSRDYNFLQTVGFSREYEHKRINALWKIITGDFDIVLADIDAFTQKTASIQAVKSAAITLSVGEELNLSDFKEKLVFMGYDFTEQVDGVGQFSVRGGIVDVFSPSGELPVRIELWGDEIDSVSYFDPTDQRRTDTVENAVILPACEFFEEPLRLAEILDCEAKKSKSRERITLLNRDMDILKSGGILSVDRYMNSIKNVAVPFADYSEGNIVAIAESRNVFARLKNIEEARLLQAEDLFNIGVYCKESGDFWCKKSQLQKKLENSFVVYMDAFSGGNYPIEPVKTLGITFNQNSCWGGGMDILLEDISPALESKKTIVILAGNEKNAKLLVSQLENNNIKAQYAVKEKIKQVPGVFVTEGFLSAGFDFADAKLLLISHKAAKATVKTGKKRNKGEVFNSLDELKVGDYVVHFAHGIGQFDGIHRIETNKVIKDYIKIKYRGTDVLYVPVTQLDLVSRYIGAAGENGPVLHKLGGTEWQNTRRRIKSAVKNMAKELIKLYGERLKIKGYAFSPDNELQADFEAKFPYEETADQIKAIAEIKRDMQSTAPMDRLLCGDVGFGKTEVALRAAFKCICDGKQCALLVPTTILAWQHFLTATERFGDLPVNIQMLSRFRTASQINKTLKGLKNGDVDFVIGTHRMISSDVHFRDLGLVIIDEEQRFGVAQKEKLKNLFKSVDMLTLTATPIPRTLNMAMSGIRDMSSIEEAPQDRQPVQTYVMEQNNGVLVEAIKKELKRGGQVYYLHNRVESIMHCAAGLSVLLPEAKIGVAHGKMSEEELSEVWRSVIDGEIDVLVCTTIIETGVDIPNVNTLIIEDADRMGLAQLHQIRGRVGRSNRRAYAYFCFRRGKALSEIATKRLEAIREYTEFGSGFKIAMRDLEIRGAGNILGGEQHGHIEAVGYDMYMRLLNETISEEKGEKVEKKVECTVDLDISANIPETYISSLSQRLGVYRRIVDIKTVEDKTDVIDELCDRFGEPPKEVLGLIDISLLKGAAERSGIYEISGNSEEIRLYILDFSDEKTGKLVKKLGNGVKLVPNEKMYFSVKINRGQNPTEVLKELALKL